MDGQAARNGYRLDRKRVYILPTRHGIAFACALAVMLVGSINYDSSLGYLLTFMLASVAAVSLLHTYRNLAGLTLRIGRPEPVFTGEQARAPVTIDNRGQRARHALMLVYPAAVPVQRPRRSWRGFWRRPPPERTLVELALAAGEAAVHPVAIRLERRGRLALPPLELASRYPLGFFRAWARIGGCPTALAYPAPRGRSELPPAAAARQAERGAALAGNDDYSGLREYRPGDSPKRIHWKAAARGQSIPVKLFEGGGTREIALSWSAAEQAGEPEARLGQLARWVLAAEHRALRYSLDLPAVGIPAGSGPAHRARCLTALAEYPAAPGAEHTAGTGSAARRTSSDPRTGGPEGLHAA